MEWIYLVEELKIKYQAGCSPSFESRHEEVHVLNLLQGYRSQSPGKGLQFWGWLMTSVVSHELNWEKVGIKSLILWICTSRHTTMSLSNSQEADFNLVSTWNICFYLIFLKNTGRKKKKLLFIVSIQMLIKAKVLIFATLLPFVAITVRICVQS